jgi:uncharacterized repeat protein (TIGR03803 family)
MIREISKVLARVFAVAITITAFTIALAHAQTLTVLHSFTGGSSDGSSPLAGVVRDSSSGSLYGTTEYGGTSGDGVVFKTTSTGSTSVLHSFTGGSTNGSTPLGGVFRDSSGNLYGTTEYGGTSNAGVVYKITSTGTFSLLHSFTGGSSDGSTPWATVIGDSSGNLYGTTYYGGTSNAGVVYKITSTGSFSVLHSFTGGNTDGANAIGGLVRDSSGNLYGTTFYGGTSNDGVVFKITSTGTFSVLHSFTGGSSDGANSLAGLIVDSSGNLYGTTEYGGTSGDGVVFKTTPTGSTSVLHSFTGGSTNGSTPLAGVYRDSSGNLYGTTEYGGTSNEGVIYKITSTGTFSVLHSFTGGSSDGSTPFAVLVMDSSSNLYGTTEYGGTSNAGIVFKF